jgi:hypothetical protein
MSCNGKPGSMSKLTFVGERRPMKRLVKFFLFSSLGASTDGFSVVSASLSRSTIADSVACCFLASGALRGPPSVAVVLLGWDRSDADSDRIEFLRKQRQILSILITWLYNDEAMEQSQIKTSENRKVDIRHVARRIVCIGQQSHCWAALWVVRCGFVVVCWRASI